LLNTNSHCQYSAVALVGHFCTRPHFKKSQVLEFTVLHSSKMKLNLNPT